MVEQMWKVVGGGDKGGIMVRAGQDLCSAELPSRLSTGALVHEVELQGERLHFKRASGTGPDSGWVSISLKGRALMERVPLEDGATEKIDAQNTNGGDVQVTQGSERQSSVSQDVPALDEFEDEEEEEPIEPTVEGLLKALLSERQKRTQLNQKLRDMGKELRSIRSRLNDSPGVFTLGERKPTIHPSAYVAPGAAIIGTVDIKKDASVWFNCTLRGDNEVITVGENSDVQDNSILHCDPGKPLQIGRNVLVGHQVCLHGCKIGDNCLIGMRSTILDNAIIGNNTFVAAGTTIPEGRVIPPNSFVQGATGKRIELESAMPDGLLIVQNAYASYVENKDRFKAHLKPCFP